MRPRRSLRRRLLRGLVGILLAWVAITLGVIVLLRWINPPTTAFILQDRIGAALADEPGYDFHMQWRAWDRISPNAALAVVAAEDQRFPLHHGFDFRQIDKALDDRRKGARVRGASTISQQVAKNLFLWPGQSWVRKGLEAALTIAIEIAWPKQRILEIYLNIAEFGRATYGVEAASQRYYRKSAAGLTSTESALLAAVLPSPRRFKVNAATPYLRQRQAWIEQQMRSLGGTAYVRTMD
jgi:monofunctional biosynthetic peptidoglycan transglycosylase